MVEWRDYLKISLYVEEGYRGKRKETEGEARRTEPKGREKRGSFFGWLFSKKEKKEKKASTVNTAV